MSRPPRSRSYQAPARPPAQQDPGPLIDALYYLVNRRIAERLAELGFPEVRPAHGKVFENLRPGSTVNSLAESAQISKQAMAELVKHLETHGLLRRIPHPDDRRARIVQLTHKGKRAVRRALAVLGDLYRQCS